MLNWDRAGAVLSLFIPAVWQEHAKSSSPFSQIMWDGCVLEHNNQYNASFAMKNKILLLLCMLLLVIGFLWLFHRREQSIPLLDVTKTNITVADVVAQHSISTQKVNTNIFMIVSNTPRTAPANASLIERARAMLEERNAPVNFWGRVIDQDGNPLSDVKVESQIRHWDFPPEKDPDGRQIKSGLITDENGRFHIYGSSGDSLKFSFIKDGYEVEPNKQIWGTTVGTFDSPTTFRMWSTNIHEQLITGSKRFHIVPDGRTYIVDLVKDTIGESGDGDLKIWIKRPDPIVFGQRYDWSCEMAVVNGGLLQETDAYSSMFSAPAEGYVPSFQFEQKTGSGWGDSTGSKRFYLMLKNGREYGRITIELYAYYNDHIPGLIDIKYAVNPSGSHILKP